MGKSSSRLMALLYLAPLVVAGTTAVVIPLLTSMPAIVLGLGALLLIAGLSILAIANRRKSQGTDRQPVRDAIFWPGGLSVVIGTGYLFSGLAFLLMGSR